MAQPRPAHARDRDTRRTVPLRAVDRHAAHGHGARRGDRDQQPRPAGALQQLGDDPDEGGGAHRGERARDHRVPRLPPPHQHVRVGVVGVAAGQVDAYFTIEIPTQGRLDDNAGHGARSPAHHLHGLTTLGGGSARQRLHIVSNGHRSMQGQIRQAEEAEAARPARLQRQSERRSPSSGGAAPRHESQAGL